MKNHLPGLLTLLVLWVAITLLAARLSPESPL